MDKTQLIVTSGWKYTDIDGYASMIAYRELLKADGKNASASTSAAFNQSVPPLILNLRYRLDAGEASSDNAKYIVVDASNPSFFDRRVTNENLLEVIDHHTGFEDYWRNRPGVKTQIEFIGAACTIIYERIVAAGHTEILDLDLCKLLMAGILDNTLNLKSGITTERDRAAYAALMKASGVSSEFSKEYFTACETEILKDFAWAIRNDLKIEKVGALPEVFGQMVLYDAKSFDVAEAAKILAKYPEWIMNVVALENGKSYIFFAGDGVQERLERLFGGRYEDDGALALDHCLLRKEIMKIAREERRE